MRLTLASALACVTVALLAAAQPSLAQALSCSFSINNLNFGTVDSLSGAPARTSANLRASCNGLPNREVVICPNLGSGTGGAKPTTRSMNNSANILEYQLYSDPARLIPWGSYLWPYSPKPPEMNLTLDASGRGSISRQIYGEVFGGQTTAATGSYLSTFSGTHATFLYRYAPSSCYGAVTGSMVHPNFLVTATVAPNCLIATKDVDFGARGVLSSAVDATGQVAVTCTPNTSYTVSLSGGLSNGTPTARKMFKGKETVTYGLYKDPARSQPWGDASTPGSTMPGSGNGQTRYLPVYGRVRPQATPSAGVYTDTVVVTVTY
ncbi:Csu type fimbrial protein [Chelativorans intermedius]|uniref:Spore coat protein U domain-containing protein n=1 Tax=Chelativorans intermedius TaxID=515947 RepID=A0ABV6DAR1_9HYPH|nr:spore coat protein U domain-containing protein [Chelativorans intermedius]MCT9000136.1 spore coat U domain-containing protein [Chelativorans intermedius]